MDNSGFDPRSITADWDIGSALRFSLLFIGARSHEAFKIRLSTDKYYVRLNHRYEMIIESFRV